MKPKPIWKFKQQIQNGENASEKATVALAGEKIKANTKREFKSARRSGTRGS